ncbi:MAG: hypothetical protein LC785_08990 [Acidobacteria bacterium]|nr:hypothetical protein [Acidobacteriota bacterium]MCA1642070.1 hypothetical protein [Acidobacteriota bacterium]
MNLVSRDGSSVVVKQVPVLLLFVTALFSLPPIAFSLFHILGGTDADGKYFSLFFGLFMLWLFLEFVATRERLGVDLAGKVLRRTVSGVFRNGEQVIDLRNVEGIGLEVRRDARGAKRIRRQYLYVYGSGGKFLLNSPAKVYLDHGKLGRALSEVTGIPFRVMTDGNRG